MAYSAGGLDLADTSLPLRLAYDSSGTTDVGFSVSAGGDLTITPDGGAVTIAGTLAVTGGEITIDGTDGAIAAGSIGLFEASGSIAISSRNEVHVLLDNDANGTTNAFRVYTNAATSGAATEVLTVSEAGTLAIGSGSKATTGVLRIPNNQGLYARNAADSANHNLVTLTGSNVLSLMDGTVTVNTSGDLGIAGDLNHDGSAVGFYGTAPAAQSNGWTLFSNLTPTYTLDADSTSLAEVADVLGTVVEELKKTGLFAA